MINFKEDNDHYIIRHKNIDISMAVNTYTGWALIGTNVGSRIYPEELRQIADKLDKLNREVMKC